MRRPGLAIALGVVSAALSLRVAGSCRVAHAQEQAHEQAQNEAGGAPQEAVRQEPARRVLTLSDAERAAQALQPQVLIARAATRSAEAVSEQARSPLFPQITATASYTRATGNYVARQGAVPNSTGAQPNPTLTSYDYWNVGIAGTQLIYDFGQTTGKYGAARATVEAQRAAEQTTRLGIVSGVRRAYFNARAMRSLVDVAHETLDDQNKHLTQVQAFVEVGTQPPIAVATQRALVANARVQLIAAQNNYETAKSQLNQAAGIVGGTDYEVADDDLSPVEDEDQPLSALVARAVAARPEFATLQKQRDAQDATLHAARGGYGPTLSALAGVNAAGAQLDNLVPNGDVELLLTWPIFQGGLTRGEVHQAEAGIESVDAQRGLELLQVQLDVDSARLAVRAAKATIGASDDALTNAREQLHLAEQRFATGVGNIIELTDAQVAYTSAAAQVVQARYGLATARAQLLAALGRT